MTWHLSIVWYAIVRFSFGSTWHKVGEIESWKAVPTWDTAYIWTRRIQRTSFPCLVNSTVVNSKRWLNLNSEIARVFRRLEAIYLYKAKVGGWYFEEKKETSMWMDEYNSYSPNTGSALLCQGRDEILAVIRRSVRRETMQKRVKDFRTASKDQTVAVTVLWETRFTGRGEDETTWQQNDHVMLNEQEKLTITERQLI